MQDYLGKGGIQYSLEDQGERIYNPPNNIHSNIFKTDWNRTKMLEFTPVMGVNALSQDLARIIHKLPDEKGQMIGIFGKWGRGKTFLLNELWKVIEAQKAIHYVRIEFRAWKYQETPASWAYLYELLSDEYLGKNEYGNLRSYQLRLFMLNLKRFGWLPVIKFSLTALFAIIGIFYSFFEEMFLPALGISALIGVLFISILQKIRSELSTKAVALIKKYTSRRSFKEALGIQADIQDELIKLLKVWIPDPKTANKKIFLIVEDIDRCTEERIIQNIDALRVLLEDDEICTRLIVVTAIDERILKGAIRIKYESLFPELSTQKSRQALKNVSKEGDLKMNELISEYIDKLFITAIKLGELSDDDKGDYLDELYKNDIQSEENLEISLPRNPENQKKYDAGDDAQDAVEGVTNQVIPIRETENKNRPIQNNPIRPTEELSAESIPAQRVPEWEKLNSQERSLLRKVVRLWAGVTPRRVAIFYYRYLLCKNLLIDRYRSKNLDYQWKDPQSLEAIITLIKFYSDSYNPDLIVEEKDKIRKQAFDQEIEIQNLEYRLKKKMQDYLILLDILEMVIAY